jgi:hypothetical protein
MTTLGIIYMGYLTKNENLPLSKNRNFNINIDEHRLKDEPNPTYTLPASALNISSGLISLVVL